MPAGAGCARAVAAHSLVPQLMQRSSVDVRYSKGAAPREGHY